MTGKQMIEDLKKSHPDIAIRVTRTLDESFQWDGDGPDPAEDGYLPYDVDVDAIRIRKGVVLTGTASLGGSYFTPDEPTGEVHGCLPQMIKEAMHNLAMEVMRASTSQE